MLSSKLDRTNATHIDLLESPKVPVAVEKTVPSTIRYRAPARDVKSRVIGRIEMNYLIQIIYTPQGSLGTIHSLEESLHPAPVLTNIADPLPRHLRAHRSCYTRHCAHRPRTGRNRNESHRSPLPSSSRGKYSTNNFTCRRCAAMSLNKSSRRCRNRRLDTACDGWTASAGLRHCRNRVSCVIFGDRASVTKVSIADSETVIV